MGIFQQTLTERSDPTTIKQGVEDNTTSQVLGYLGGQAIEARVGNIKADQQKDILGDIDEFLDDYAQKVITGQDPEMGGVLREYNMLKLAKDQGLMSSSELKARVESATQKHINRLPGRAEEIRNAGRQTLGDYQNRIRAIEQQEAAWQSSAASAEKYILGLAKENRVPTQGRDINSIHAEVVQRQREMYLYDSLMRTDKLRELNKNVKEEERESLINTTEKHYRETARAAISNAHSGYMEILAQDIPESDKRQKIKMLTENFKAEAEKDLVKRETINARQAAIQRQEDIVFNMLDRKFNLDAIKARLSVIEEHSTQELMDDYPEMIAMNNKFGVLNNIAGPDLVQNLLDNGKIKEAYDVYGWMTMVSQDTLKAKPSKPEDEHKKDKVLSGLVNTSTPGDAHPLVVESVKKDLKLLSQDSTKYTPEMEANIVKHLSNPDVMAEVITTPEQAGQAQMVSWRSFYEAGQAFSQVFDPTSMALKTMPDGGMLLVPTKENDPNVVSHINHLNKVLMPHINNASKILVGVGSETPESITARLTGIVDDSVPTLPESDRWRPVNPLEKLRSQRTSAPSDTLGPAPVDRASESLSEPQSGITKPKEGEPLLTDLQASQIRYLIKSGQVDEQVAYDYLKERAKMLGLEMPPLEELLMQGKK